MTTTISRILTSDPTRPLESATSRQEQIARTTRSYHDHDVANARDWLDQRGDVADAYEEQRMTTILSERESHLMDKMDWMADVRNDPADEMRQEIERKTGSPHLMDVRSYNRRQRRNLEESVWREDRFRYSKTCRAYSKYASLELAARTNDIVLDFFAGSGTTAHAVLDLNKQDGGNRKFILVQLPEPTGREDYPTIADITKERVRRVIKKLNDEDAGQARPGRRAASRTAASASSSWPSPTSSPGTPRCRTTRRRWNGSSSCTWTTSAKAARRTISSTKFCSRAASRSPRRWRRSPWRVRPSTPWPAARSSSAWSGS